MKFEWDEAKNIVNINKHGLSFDEAKLAFSDKRRLIDKDIKHSTPAETRYFLYGDTGYGIATVRFTIKNSAIRIFGAGYWRQGKKRYEKR